MAIGWYREHDPPAALRMAAAMTAFWSVRGHHTEGRQRLDELLALAAEPSLARVPALNGAAWLAIDQGDYARGADLLGAASNSAAPWATRWARPSRPSTSAGARCPAGDRGGGARYRTRRGAGHPDR